MWQFATYNRVARTRVHEALNIFAFNIYNNILMQFFCILDCTSTCPALIPRNRRWASSICSGQSETSFKVTHTTAVQALLIIRWTVKHIK